MSSTSYPVDQTESETSVPSVNRDIFDDIYQLLNANETEIRSLRSEVRSLRSEVLALMVPESSSRESQILTGHSDAWNGGAFLDPVRNQIISFSWESNKCCDFFVTQLRDATHGTTEVKRVDIPFDIRVRNPIYDGSRFFYLAESGYDNGTLRPCRRFGRVDLEDFSFEELAEIPKDFAAVFHGCFLQGVICMADNESQLWGYSVDTNEWIRYGVALPFTDGDKWRHGILLSDGQCLYCLGSFGLHRIEEDMRKCTLISSVPSGLAYTRDSILVLPYAESDCFMIVANVGGSKWSMYSSKTNKWKDLSDWDGPGTQNGRNFLVYSDATKTFYYHIHGKDRWQIVQL